MDSRINNECYNYTDGSLNGDFFKEENPSEKNLSTLGKIYESALNDLTYLGCRNRERTYKTVQKGKETFILSESQLKKCYETFNNKSPTLSWTEFLKEGQRRKQIIHQDEKEKTDSTGSSQNPPSNLSTNFASDSPNKKEKLEVSKSSSNENVRRDLYLLKKEDLEILKNSFAQKAIEEKIYFKTYSSYMELGFWDLNRSRVEFGTGQTSIILTFCPLDSESQNPKRVYIDYKTFDEISELVIEKLKSKAVNSDISQKIQEFMNLKNEKERNYQK